MILPERGTLCLRALTTNLILEKKRLVTTNALAYRLFIIVLKTEVMMAIFFQF